MKKSLSQSDMAVVVGNQSGMALLITVMTLSLLVAVTVQFHKNVWHKYRVAHNYKVGEQLKIIADSGVNIALSLIEAEGKENKSDSLISGWASLEEEPLNGLFIAGNLQLAVTDLSGLLQINSLVQTAETKEAGDKEERDIIEKELREVLVRLLLSGSFIIEEEVEATSITNALVDWVDEDDKESDRGAEDSYYQSLEIPYSCRNGPVQYIEELLLVKGVTPELFFGTEEKEGIVDYLTTYGNNGKININTAPSLLIKSMNPLITDDLLESFDEFRREEGNEEDLSQPGWYKNIGGWPGDIEINESLLTTTGTFFQISSTGAFATYARRIIAVAARGEDGEVGLLRRRVE